MTPRGERGSATVFVLVLVAVLGAVAFGGALLGGVLVGQRRAAAAADLAALAAAETLSSGGGSAMGGASACETAGRVSEHNEARLTGCAVDGLEVLVEVAVDVPAAFGGHWSVPGRARAGPSGNPSWPSLAQAPDSGFAQGRARGPARGRGLAPGFAPGPAPISTPADATASAGPAS